MPVGYRLAVLSYGSATPTGAGVNGPNRRTTGAAMNWQEVARI
jgi:hypothetical protein